jgi:hypothetical protein
MKWFSAISLACAATSLVGVPLDVSYNGSLADETGSVLDGEYFMKFAIADMDGTTFYWNNEDGNAAVGVPAGAVSVDVSQGVFSTVLEAVDSTVLANPDLYLWVFVSDTVDGTYESLGAAPLRSVPYAILAGEAESVAAENIDGQLTADQIADGAIGMDQIADGSINAEKLGTILIDVPFIDSDGDGIADDPENRNVSMKTILESISDNSKLAFNNVNENRADFEVFLDLDQEIGSIVGWAGGEPPSGGRGHFKDPFPIGQVYEYNGGLMPVIDILDADNNVITGEAGNPVPGLTFEFVYEDVERTSPSSNYNDHPRKRADGLDEGRLIVSGTPTVIGDYTVRVRATNRWGMDFVQEYTVLVRDVDITGTVFLERQALGSSSWTTSAANTPFGGDPVRARFITDPLSPPLTDDVVVRWTYPNPTGGPDLTSDIAGTTGQIFFVNSDGDPAGTGASQGVMLLDEDPETSGIISHVGTYAAQILFDWGQGVYVGEDSIDDILDGYTYSTETLQYIAPDGPTSGTPVALFDPFQDNSLPVPVGTRNGNGHYFGASPAGDEPLWDLEGTIEAGETAKMLLGENPFGQLDTGAYIRGTMTNRWLQQKIQKYTTLSGPVYSQIGIRTVESILTDGPGGAIVDPVVDLRLDGFGPMPADTAWPLAVHGGAGVIHDNMEARGAFSWPQDGGDFTYLAGSPRIRPYQGASIVSGNIESYLYGTSDFMNIYWLYSSNGFIDTLAPQAAIIEVGDNINIVNDLLDAQQVAGYPVQIGGDFGTTNGFYTQSLYPAEETSSSRVVVWGINDLAYIWGNPNNNGFTVINTDNGNSILIPGGSLVNNTTSNDSAIDVNFTLDLDSGFSLEGTDAGIAVVSDVVVWDFFLQQVDLTKNPSDPAYYPQGGPDQTNEEVEVTAGDDVLLTLKAYVRPSLYTGVDEGGVTDGLMRDLSARFFLVPFQTNTAVEITNNITISVNSAPGTDVDSDDDHVQGPIDNRVMTIWSVILENPLQDLATTNVASGYVYAVITSKKDGNVVNVVSTLAGASNAIAANTMDIDDDVNGGPTVAAEQNVIGPDYTLDARVKMPLTTAEAVITVNPAP